MSGNGQKRKSPVIEEEFIKKVKKGCMSKLNMQTKIII